MPRPACRWGLPKPACISANTLATSASRPFTAERNRFVVSIVQGTGFAGERFNCSAAALFCDALINPQGRRLHLRFRHSVFLQSKVLGINSHGPQGDNLVAEDEPNI